ncbi:hypothetical protein OsccyDRAFT_1567 [Leptolyngbyaceae cyanobacterium JSC-12]|nr:hypothetical protein OsccyDRAFT_1567 [Leptolyngbyaceae cyanobacterium JSC-12]
MLDQVAAAFERHDYETASQLLRELVKQAPHDPWVKLYVGRLQEASGRGKAAEQIYRQLLQQSTNSKLVSQARQGLQRVTTQEQPRQQPAIAQATAQPSSQELGFLILEAVMAEARTEIGQRLAQLLKTDTYTARGLLPSRGWRLYRTGTIEELALFGQALQQAGVSAFWASLAELQSIQVFQVNYIQALQPKATIVCRNQTHQVGMLSFEWSEVQQRVEGLLPLFSQVVDLGYRDRLEWKEHIEDYAHFYDLHLPAKRCILRLHDGKYDFHQGITAQEHHDTIRQRWNELITIMNQAIPPSPIQSEFTIFSESTSDFATALERLPSHMFLSRSSDCHLDPAFHLYSCLALLKLRHT